MATLTPLTTDTAGTPTIVSGTPVDWDRTSGAWVEGSNSTAQTIEDHLSQAITASVANGDTGIGLTAGANGRTVIQVPLTDVDAGFESMDTLAIGWSSAELAPNDDYVDDLVFFACRVMNSAGTVVLAAYDSSTTWKMLDYHHSSGVWTSTSAGSAQGSDIDAWGGSGTSPAYDQSNSFDYVNTSASEADWNGADIEFSFQDDRNMGSDSAVVILVDFELTGTYTPIPNRPHSLGYKGLWTPTRRPLHVGALY